MPEQESAEPSESSATDTHLEDVEDGCGCTEVWEHLSEHRDEE